MKSRSDWQHDADNACADAAEAGSGYAQAKRELEDAREEVARATQAVAAANRAVESAEAGVRMARSALSSARAELRSAEDPHERASARTAVAAAEAELADAERRLSEARNSLGEAQRELDDAESRQSAAEQALSRAREHVNRATDRLEDLLESVQSARMRADSVQVAAGPQRFPGHFDAAKEAWAGEVSFYNDLAGQLESALSSLASEVEAADRPRLSMGIGGGWRDKWSPMGMGGFGFLGGGMPWHMFGAGFGFPSIAGFGALPGFIPGAFGGGMSSPCCLGTSSLGFRTPVSYPTMSTPPIGVGLSGLSTPVGFPSFSTPSLAGPSVWPGGFGLSTPSVSRLSLSTPVLGIGGAGSTPTLGTSVLSGLTALPAFGTPSLAPPTSFASPVGGSLLNTSALPSLGTVGTLSGPMDLPYAAGLGGPMLASGGSTFQKMDAAGAGVLTIDPGWATHIHHSVDPLDPWWHIESQAKLASGAPAFEFSGWDGGFAQTVDSMLPPSFANFLEPVSSAGFGGGFGIDGDGFIGGCGLCS